MATTTDYFLPADANITAFYNLNGTTVIPIDHGSYISYAERVAIGVLLMIICIIGLFGNSLTIIAVIISKKLRTTTNVFVVNLAVADLLTCLFQPWDAIGLWSKNGWPIAPWICTVSSAVAQVCLCFTIIDLAFIAVNRYHKILYLLRTYQRIYSPRNIIIMLASGWLYCFFVVVLPPIFGVGGLGYSHDLKTCANDETNPLDSLYTLVCAALIYPIPLVIVVFCYTKIFLYVRRHQQVINMRRKSSGMSLRRDGTKKSANENAQQIQITKNLLYVVIAFILCLGPYVLAVSIEALIPARHWVGLLALFNSCVNPIIYGFKHPGFREVFTYMLKGKWKYIPEPASFVHQFRSTQRGSLPRSPQSSVKENKDKITFSDEQKSPPAVRPSIKDNKNKVSFSNEAQMKISK